MYLNVFTFPDPPAHLHIILVLFYIGVLNLHNKKTDKFNDVWFSSSAIEVYIDILLNRACLRIILACNEQLVQKRNLLFTCRKTFLAGFL